MRIATGRKIDFTFQDDIAFDVLVVPKEGAKVEPAVFTAELRAYGKGRARHWLVDSWQAKGVSSATEANTSGAPAVALGEKGRLSAAYLLVPLAIFSLVIIVPVGFGIRGLWRAKAAERAYTSSSRPS